LARAVRRGGTRGGRGMKPWGEMIEGGGGLRTLAKALTLEKAGKKRQKKKVWRQAASMGQPENQLTEGREEGEKKANR